jgi:hypothetical protein
MCSAQAKIRPKIINDFILGFFVEFYERFIYYDNMSLLFESIYGKNDLERRTRLFYEAYIKNSSNIKEVFIDSYGIKYELIFGDLPYDLAVYSLLKHYYRNEYFIKKSFVLHKLLCSQSVTFTEYPINDSRADIVSINGHSTAYEIKTIFDNLSRLDKQVSDYSKCFEYIYVICPEEKVKQASAIIPKHCGIYVYNSERMNSSFKKIKEAKTSPDLCPTSILASITKEELLINFRSNSRKEVKQKLSLCKINEAYKNILKLRYVQKWEAFKNECALISRH